MPPPPPLVLVGDSVTFQNQVVGCARSVSSQRSVILGLYSQRPVQQLQDTCDCRALDMWLVGPGH